MSEEAQVPVDLAAADADYKRFPSFRDWTGSVPNDDLWHRGLARMDKARKETTPEQLGDAFRFVMRAAAIDTGAIEGLYEVDRGFTFTVAAQDAAWQAAMDEHGAQVRPLFE